MKLRSINQSINGDEQLWLNDLIQVSTSVATAWVFSQDLGLFYPNLGYGIFSWRPWVFSEDLGILNGFWSSTKIHWENVRIFRVNDYKKHKNFIRNVWRWIEHFFGKIRTFFRKEIEYHQIASISWENWPWVFLDFCIDQSWICFTFMQWQHCLYTVSAPKR